MGKSPVCLMNCHLAHGKSNSQKRFNEMKKIYNTVAGELGEKHSSKHDVQFLFGSLNFQLESAGKSANVSVQKQEISKLLKSDQLWSQYHQYNYLPRLSEAPITFLPTYKSIKDSDLSGSPAFWCDRILWGTSELVECTHYTSVEELSTSDHRPVYGIYLVNVSQRKSGHGLSASLEEDKQSRDLRRPHFAKSSSTIELYGKLRD